MDIHTMPMRRWISKTIAIACMTLLLVMILIGYTTFGLNLALRYIHFMLPNMISYTGVSGTLAQGVRIDALTIHYADMEIQLEDLAAKINMADLVTGKIHIENIVIPKIFAPQYPLLQLTQVTADVHFSTDDLQVNAQYSLPQYDLAQKLVLQGTLNAYHLTLHNRIGEQTVTLTGTGTPSQLSLAGKDTIEFDVSANWQHELQLYLHADGKLYIPQIQTEIDINHLAMSLDGSNAKIQVPGIEGLWQGKPLHIQGEGQIQDHVYHGNLNLEYEKHMLQASGVSGNTLSIQGETHILDLSDFIPSMGGKLTIQTTVTGDHNNPDVQVQYAIEDFIYQANHVEKAQGVLELRGDQTVEGKLTLQNATLGYREIQHADISLTGNKQQHQLSLTATNETSKISALIEGAYADPSWQGIIKKLTIVTAKHTLHIPKPIPISYHAHVIEYQDVCLRDNKQGALCLQGHLDLVSRAWENTIDLQSFLLESLGDIPIGASAIIKEGLLQGHLTIRGQNKTIIDKSGHITLQNLLVYLIPQNTPLWLQQGNIKADKQKLTVRLDTKHKTYDFHIQATCQNGNCDGTIEGEHVPLSNTRTLRLIADPHLQFSLKNYRIFLRGNANIHHSAIAISTHGNVLTLPHDVHIMQPHLQDSRAPLLLLDPSSTLRVTFGKDVNIIISNTSAKLQGALNMTFPKDSLPICNGKIRLLEGEYKGYGQRLTISTGDISYTDTVIDNPTLDIIAVKEVQLDDDTFDLRNLNEDKVGVRITGTAENPLINLFSYPDQLPEDEILSLLITGQKTTFNDNGTTSGLSPYMLGSYLLETTGSLSNISKILSLDTVHIFDSSTHTSGAPADFTIKNKDDSMKIMVTKHLNKRFSVNGNFDIYSNEYKVSAQYKLTPRLSIKTYISDLSEGIGLLYRIESNH